MVRIRRKVKSLEREADRAKRRRVLTRGGQEFWPLDAPGMPEPGSNFLEAAQAEGDDTVYVKKAKGKDRVFVPGRELLTLYGRALREPGFTLNVLVRPGQRAPVTFVPGHIWGQHAEAWQESRIEGTIPPRVDGPHRADVMVISKMPWRDEIKALRNLVGTTGEVLLDMIRRLRIRGAAKWYVTNLVKFCPPEGMTTIKAGWINDCKILLAQELRIVRPKYILCLGADASKALLGPQYNVTYMDGRVVPYEYPIHISHDDEPEFHRAQVVTVIHPHEAAKEQSKNRILERGMSRFSLLIRGEDFSHAEDELDHRVIDTLEDAQEWVEEVNAYFADRPKRDRLVAWDAEWQGQHPLNAGAYLRTIQASWAPKHAVCFKLTHAGGKRAFRDRDGRPALKRLMRLLQTFADDKRAVGHFLVADLEWLVYHGFDPTRNCQPPLDPDARGRPAWDRFRRGAGWLDTAMMAHAIEETAPLGLEALAMRYTTVPRYDIPMEDWKKEYCKARGIKLGALEGYGDAPDKDLISYANYDADATLRLALALRPLLDYDYDGNCCWESAWEKHIIQPAILAIHRNGIKVDRRKIDRLTGAFVAARAVQEDRIRDWADWPDFNIRSTQQVREFLFGTARNGKLDQTGRPVRIRPKGARILGIEPLLDTSKPPRRWEDLRARGQERDAVPGTGKMILAILAQDNLNVAEQINWLRDYRFLDQVLKSVLRHPTTDEDGTWLTDDDGMFEYEAGLAACIDDDGRVRTHIYPTAETGRWKSSRPNLQNISKSRDPDYKRILGDEYREKLRSILIADDGFALVEFDYSGAELYGMALMAGDAAMIEHAQRSLYPDSGYDNSGAKVKGGKAPHPLYYDIHSNVAVLAFQLKVTDHVFETKDRSSPLYGKTAAQLLNLPVGAALPATKFALMVIGKLHFRTLAKNVIFGIAYGRGAKAIALQAKEQGVNVTADEAQIVIDTIFAMYPGLVPFFAEAKGRATRDRWLCHCFGSFRRFISTSDEKIEGEFERQAMNFPIQGMIASAVNRGLARLHRLIVDYGLEDDVRLLLQIHDAGLLEVRHELIPFVVKELIPYAMVDCVPIYPGTLDGVPTGAGPYHLGLDITVEKQWGGARYSRAECRELGIPLKYAALS